MMVGQAINDLGEAAQPLVWRLTSRARRDSDVKQDPRPQAQL